MMDLKEIIKWFIPCFHILQVILKAKHLRLTFIFLFLFFRVASADSLGMGNDAKKLNSFFIDKSNQSDVFDVGSSRSYVYGSMARTFGRPFKKMMGALLPLVFQIGAASTWAVVAALVGIKTLVVTLVILKILLMAGAAKILADADVPKRPRPASLWLLPRFERLYNGTFYNGTLPRGITKFGAVIAQKGHHKPWEPPPHYPQKEIHVHIHNGGHHEVHDDQPAVYGPWSREDPANSEQKVQAIDPYLIAGPQTIKTPFGNYMKIESADHQLTHKRK